MSLKPFKMSASGLAGRHHIGHDFEGTFILLEGEVEDFGLPALKLSGKLTHLLDWTRR